MKVASTSVSAASAIALKKVRRIGITRPLLDVVRRERGFGTYRFTGKSAAEWVADLRERKSLELDRFIQWYEALVGHFLEELAKRPRFPENIYSIELAKPPLTSSLPSLIRRVGLNRASAEQWVATLRGAMIRLKA